MIHPSIIYSQAQLDGYQQAYDFKSRVAPKARASVENAGMLPNKGSLSPTAGKSYQSAPVSQATRPAPIQPATSPSQRAMQNKLRNRRRR